MKVQAKTHFVWTELAQEIDPKRIAGRPITDLYPNYKDWAPETLLDRGYIVDSEDYEGQTDLFTALEGV